MKLTADRNGARRSPRVAAAGMLRIHDRVTDLGLALAMAGLGGIVVSYCFEVVARYFFNAPTQWSAGLVSYLLLFVTFLAMPQVTREGSHVAVTVLIERLPPEKSVIAARLITLIGLAVCIFLTVIATGETLRQFERGVRMMSALPAPKGWISVWMIYGFAGSALYFLRAALVRPATHPIEDR